MRRVVPFVSSLLVAALVPLASVEPGAGPRQPSIPRLADRIRATAPPGATAQKRPTGVLADARLEGTFIALSVADAAASARWYEEILGFRVFKRIDPPTERVHIVLMERAGAILEIIEHPRAKSSAAWNPDAKEPFDVHGIFKAGFRVSDLDRVLHGLRGRKVEIRNGPFDIPELQLRSFIAVDPDGNLLQFFGK
jgi:catechol 2,3-dioxygenase-like lactoylglutathione lyase family enzyme